MFDEYCLMTCVRARQERVVSLRVYTVLCMSPDAGVRACVRVL
jgi:ribosomal protein S12